MGLEIEIDASIGAFELTDYNGDESQVIVYNKGIVAPDNPVYFVGMGKRQFIAQSIYDDGHRVNRLLINISLIKELAKGL